jgi:hypothetical protein
MRRFLLLSLGTDEPVAGRVAATILLSGDS